MKKLNKTLFFVTFIIVSNTGYSQTIATPYEVATWRGFRQAAITYTFDDGCANQFTIAIPMFNEFGFKMTLFTVTSWGPNWTNLQNAASQGHEIASHTVTHASLGSLTIAQQTTEISNSQSEINTHVTGQRCITLAYPSCITGNATLCAQYFIAARGCQGFIEPRTPGSFMNVSSIVCGDQGTVQTEQNFNTRVENAATSGGWCVFLIHAIDNDAGYSPVSSAALRASVQYLYTNGARFWVSTFANVARYIRERNSASVTESSNQSTTITLQVTDTLDNTLYNYPITLRRPLPLTWSSASVTQNGHAVDTSTVVINSTRYIMFDVVPDGGDIVLTKTGATSVQQLEPNGAAATDDLRVWVDHETLMFSVPTSAGLSLSVTLYDLQGKNVASYKVNRKTEGNCSIHLSETIVKSGMYVVRITDGKTSWTKQITIFQQTKGF